MLRFASVVLALTLLAAPAGAQPHVEHRAAQVRLARFLNENPEHVTLLRHRRLTIRRPDGGPLAVSVFKYVDTTTGTIRQLALDRDDNIIDDLPKRRAEARAADRDDRDKLGPGLFERLAKDEGAEARAERYPVLLQLRVLPPPGPPRRGRDAGHLEAAWQRARAYDMRIDAVFDKIKTNHQNLDPDHGEPDRGDKVRLRPRRTGPFVQASLTRAEIRQLAEDGDIVGIYEVDSTDLDEPEELLDDDFDQAGHTLAKALCATGTQKAHAAEADGADVRVAIVEPGGPLDADCFDVSKEQVQDWSVARAAAGEFVAHGTKSAAMIRSTYDDGACDGTPQGYAPAATLILANKGADDVFDPLSAYDFVRQVEADIISMSFQLRDDPARETNSDRDILFDYLVTQPPFPLVVASAGRLNLNGEHAGDYVAAKGYNVLSVADVLLDWDDDRRNDTLSLNTPGGDPKSEHGDRELPSIAAPGSTHYLYGTSYGGTSAATQAVAGIAALVLAKAPDELRGCPEAVRAILQASADATPFNEQPWTCEATYDGRHGAGIINAERAVTIVETRVDGADTSRAATRDGYDGAWVYEDDFEGGVLQRRWTVEVPGNGARLRVALAWLNFPRDEDGDWTVLQTNLDLLVYREGEELEPKAFSASVDESYELVDMDAEAGRYIIKVQTDDPTDLETRLGVAWTVVPGDRQ
jgi:subtilisin family serine protease